MRHGSQLTGLSRVRNVLTATITQSDNGPDNGWGLFVSKAHETLRPCCANPQTQSLSSACRDGLDNRGLDPRIWATAETFTGQPWLPAWIAPASASAPTSWRREAELPVGHSPDDYVAARGSIEPGRLSERGRFPAFVRADEPGDLTG